MIITISGPAGSGKSTIAKMLAEKLGWPRYYMGGLRRDKARERGLTLEEYNKLGETDPSTDLEIDEYQRELGKTKDNFIIEGRTSWYFIPSSIKVYIDVEEEEGAKRIFISLNKEAETRNEANSLHSEEDVLENNRKRRASDIMRYEKYYNIDVYNKKNYDIVINTTNKDIKTVFFELEEALNLN